MVNPFNLEGMPFLDMEQISVNEYHPLPDGEGPPTQVHLWIKFTDAPGLTLVMRFKSGAPMDELIAALITHRKAVFGP